MRIRESRMRIVAFTRLEDLEPHQAELLADILSRITRRRTFPNKHRKRARMMAKAVEWRVEEGVRRLCIAIRASTRANRQLADAAHKAARMVCPECDGSRCHVDVFEHDGETHRFYDELQPCDACNGTGRKTECP